MNLMGQTTFSEVQEKSLPSTHILHYRNVRLPSNCKTEIVVVSVLEKAGLVWCTLPEASAEENVWCDILALQ